MRKSFGHRQWIRWSFLAACLLGSVGRAEAAKVLFIGELEEPAEGDPGAIARIEGLGHRVTYQQGINTQGSDVAAYDLLVLSATNITANVRPNGFDSIPQPILTWESSMVRNDLPVGQGEFWITEGQQSGQTGSFITVTDATHPIFAGLNVKNGDELEMFTEDQNFFGLLGPVAPGARVAAVGADPCCADDRIMIVDLPKGAKTLPGSPFAGENSPGNRVFIPLSNTAFDFLSDEGLKLFDNAVALALGTSTSKPGDFNNDGVLDARDIDRLSAEVRSGANVAAFDLNQDNKVNSDDRTVWVQTLRKTYFGDADMNGEFSSADFVAVFQQGEYEDATANNSTWADGDWDGDGEFSSSDFVAAFQDGGFEIGPRAAVQAVPEPSTWGLAVCGILLLRRRRRSLSASLS